MIFNEYRNFNEPILFFRKYIRRVLRILHSKKFKFNILYNSQIITKERIGTSLRFSRCSRHRKKIGAPKDWPAGDAQLINRESFKIRLSVAGTGAETGGEEREEEEDFWKATMQRYGNSFEYFKRFPEE